MHECERGKHSHQHSLIIFVYSLKIIIGLTGGNATDSVCKVLTFQSLPIYSLMH